MGNALRVVDTDDTTTMPLALELAAGTSFEQWVVIGRRLCLGAQVVNWHIGDWWAFGDHSYGERAKAAAEGIFGFEFQSLIDMATVARRFPPTRRRVELSFTHHREAAVLPPEVADELLARAEQEHLSTRALRREVQALRGDAPRRSAEVVELQAKLTPDQQAKRDLLVAYEAVIELGDALKQFRALTKREDSVVKAAVRFVAEAHVDHRPCPPDFDVIFVEKGRLDCEQWYRASRITINRWLIERGKARLLEQRSAFVKFSRQSAKDARKPAPPPPAEPMMPIDAVTKQAAHFLRATRNGGWAVSPTSNGEWFVGTARLSAEDMVARAVAGGFDKEAARLQAEASEDHY